MDLSRNSITAEDFDRFLSALDPDRERAGVKYEVLRAKLIRYFMSRGSDDPDYLADETINIAARNIQNVEESHNVDHYLYAVAKRIALESLRRSQRHTSLSESSTTPREAETEITYTCIEQCMAKLNPEWRDLIVRYYEAKGSKKIQNRTAIAQELGLTVNALRIRSHHIRATLEKCITECQKNQQEEH